jgi:hypothetical protein
MKGLSLVLLLGFGIGYLGSIGARLGAQTPSAVVARPDTLPPLYTGTPQKPRLWKGDELRTLGEKLAELARAGAGMPGDAIPMMIGPDGGPRIAGQDLGLFAIGAQPFVRLRYPAARPSNGTSQISHYDDADIHCYSTAPGCSGEFTSMIYGAGKFIVNGQIMSTERPDVRGAGYSAGTRPTVNLSTGIVLGQPVVGGDVYDAKPGDWLVIPPGVIHWWNPDPLMAYFHVRIPTGAGW